MEKEESYDMMFRKRKKEFIKAIGESPLPFGLFLINDDEDLSHEYGGWEGLYFISPSPPKRGLFGGKRLDGEIYAEINIYPPTGTSIYDGGSKIVVKKECLYDYLEKLGGSLGIEKIVKDW